MPTPPSLTKLAEILDKLERIKDYIVARTYEEKVPGWDSARDSLEIILDAEDAIRLHIARRIEKKLL